MSAATPAKSEWPFREIAAAKREFKNCDTCEMPGTCRSVRHCAGPSLQHVAAQVDADTIAWRTDAETLWCDAVNSRTPADLQALRAHLDKVVAVRA